jgi:hypothetical protein
MVLHLENAINKTLPSMEKRFANDSVQRAIVKTYKKGDTFTSLTKHTKDHSLIKLLKEASASGYMLETAEGFFFPVVDYASLKPYNTYVSADIKAYIAIKAVESEQPSVKDAGLMIGYQQLVNRALSQEKFIQQYPNTVIQLRD